ncbi:hypothetical protein BCR34DRAFT_605462 [Clohesyomyces aquaticus]|uniref:Extracellular membrane protein CFEM domain-containing protein n=1 Tax=Clohesyomyces aquaticus TaxID=1231657 RepID=A0A1Y1YXL8_9PLEO|nr:hypothetical protein BCR34DRAFT_605462 [Clohesyomyces aquaticus]
MTSYGFAKWIEGARFFARPRAVNATCSGTDEQDTFSSCRASAAGKCEVPSDATIPGDACVCATVADYNKKFSACVLGTPYSACIDPNNDQIMATWSSEHCRNNSTPSATPTVKSTPTPKDTPTPSATPSAKSEPSSTPNPSTPGPLSEKPSEKPSRSSPPPSSPEPSSKPPSSTVQTSEHPSSSPEPTSEQHSSKTPQITPSEVPKPSFVPVTVVSRVPAMTTGGSTSSSSTHAPVPKWTGSGNLLQGYCATPEFSLLDGPTAYWAPIVGCVGDKPDCCPFDVPPSTIAGATGPVTIVITIPASQSSNIPTGSGGFPIPLQPAQATLDRCPDDYHSIGDGCCPSNYFPWSTAFGGQTPCYSTLPIAITPPPIPDSLAGTASATASAKPTSAIVNVVYAMQYPVKPSKGLTSNAKIGIGAGAGGAAIIFGALLWLLIWKHKAHKKDKALLESQNTSTRQSVALGNVRTPSTVSEPWKTNRNAGAGPPGGQSRFTEGLEPTLPNVGPPTAHTADWRPTGPQRTVSPPLPGTYTRNPISYAQQQRYPSPPLPEGYAEVQGQEVAQNRRYSNVSPPVPDPRYDAATGNLSELQGDAYVQGQGETYQQAPQMYARPQGQQWQQPPPPGTQTRYYDAPAGRYGT